MSFPIPVPKALRTPEQMRWYLLATGWALFHSDPEQQSGDIAWIREHFRKGNQEVALANAVLHDWPHRRQTVLVALLEAGQLKLASFLDPIPTKCGARVHYEVIGGMRVKREGEYSYRCPDCGAEGTTRLNALHCPS